MVGGVSGEGEEESKIKVIGDIREVDLTGDCIFFIFWGKRRFRRRFSLAWRAQSE